MPLPGTYPSLRELDHICRARLSVARVAEVARDDQTLYVTREELVAMLRYPDDASLVGFTRTHDGFAYLGRPVKSA